MVATKKELQWRLEVVSIVVHCFGLANPVLRIRNGSPQKGTTMETTHRLPSSSFLGLPDRILNMNHKKGIT